MMKMIIYIIPDLFLQTQHMDVGKFNMINLDIDLLAVSLYSLSSWHNKCHIFFLPPAYCSILQIHHNALIKVHLGSHWYFSLL